MGEDRHNERLRPDPQWSTWDADIAQSQILDITIADALAQAAAQWPEREAVVFTAQPQIGEVRWTFGQFNRQVIRLAAALAAGGYRSGERIAVWGPNHPEWLLLEYAIAKAGLVIVALNPLYKQAELRFALEESGASAIFHADRARDVEFGKIIAGIAPCVPKLRGVHSFSDGIRTLLDNAPSDFVHPCVEPGTLFMIQYTSGTTGTPKAARIAHNAVATTAFESHRLWGIGAGDKVCHGFPLFHIGGSGCCTPGAALVGATTLPLYIFKAERTLDILEKERCKVFLGVPTMLMAMLEDPSFERRDLSALRYLIVGGAPVALEQLQLFQRRYGAEVINCYGQTETCGVTTSTRSCDSAELKATTSGIAMPGVSLKLVDENGVVVAHGRRGELLYKGPGRMLGYGSEAPDAEIDADGWLRSGDLATMDDQGFIRIAGRTRDMIIRGGENLSPVEIESLILRHPGVAEAAVVGVPDRKYGEEACAVIRLAGASNATAEELRRWCEDRISRWKVPKYFAFVSEFPLTPSGKVKKFMLREAMVRKFGLHTHQEYS